MGFLGLWGGVLRVILGRRRGVDGVFCREIPGFLVWMRARRSDSAHGGHERSNWAKNFLKIFKKGVKNPKVGVREVPESGMRAPYIGCTGRFLGLEARPLAALPEVRFVQGPQLQAPAMRSQRFAPLIYIESLQATPFAHLVEVSLLVRPAIS